MDFLDETHTTRWASVCVFSNILLILLAIASGVVESSLVSLTLPLILPQTLLIAPLLFQLICLAVFTFSARSGALQLFKYQLQIPFLGRWMLPVIVLTLSFICLGTLSRGLISTTSQPFSKFFFTITLAQLALHFLHLLNLTWGFIHYLWTPRPRQYQPIHLSKKTTGIESDIRPLTSSGHLSKAYLNLSDRNRPGFHAEEPHQGPSGSSPKTQANNSPEIDPSVDISLVQKSCLTTAQLVRFSRKSNTWHAWHLWFLWELTILLAIAICVSLSTTLWMIVLVQRAQRTTGDRNDHRVPKRAAFTAILSPAGGLLTMSSAWWLLTRGGHFLDGERHHLLQLKRSGTLSKFKVGEELASGLLTSGRTPTTASSSSQTPNAAKPSSEHSSRDQTMPLDKWPCPHFKHQESKTHRRNILIVITCVLLIGVLASLGGIGSTFYSAEILKDRVGDPKNSSWLPFILYFLDFVSSIWISGASLVLVLFLWFFR